MARDDLTAVMQFATMPNNYIFLAFFFVLPKRNYQMEVLSDGCIEICLTVLTNAVLTSLNARSNIRKTHFDGSDHVSIHLSNHGGVRITQESEVSSGQVCSPSPSPSMVWRHNCITSHLQMVPTTKADMARDTTL